MKNLEWPTLIGIGLCYLIWGTATAVLPTVSLAMAIIVAGVALTFFSSLSHEAIHGHPFGLRWLDEALVFPALDPFMPYARFRDLHIAHHRDATLTDPYDDPETAYLDPAVWDRLPRVLRMILWANNTLLGRMMIGPFVSLVVFVRDDWRLALAGDGVVIRAWLRHGAALVPVVLWLIWVAQMPVWGYLLAVYIGQALLRLRIFAEHQAHEHSGGRTVIIEDRGPLALLFLNNNFHAVHHMNPDVPWYALPGLYAQDRQRYLTRNLGYRFPSYRAVLGRYLLRHKEPVRHPFYDG